MLIFKKQKKKQKKKREKRKPNPQLSVSYVFISTLFIISFVLPYEKKNMKAP